MFGTLLTGFYLGDLCGSQKLKGSEVLRANLKLHVYWKSRELCKNEVYNRHAYSVGVLPKCGEWGGCAYLFVFSSCIC